MTTNASVLPESPELSDAVRATVRYDFKREAWITTIVVQDGEMVVTRPHETQQAAYAWVGVLGGKDSSGPPSEGNGLIVAVGE